IEGESGTGKELVAEAIHARSTRADGPFVVFDCAAVPPDLVESELFGHEKGAFTGATARRMGRMEEADGGTLFLDELGELPLDLQPKLLMAIEKREIRRVGGTEAKELDVRIVAATNRDLAAEVNRGAFRADLYYRLAVVRVKLPPLRERREDVPLLVEHFVRKALAGDPALAEVVLRSISTSNQERLASHPWPGNVRARRLFSSRSPPRARLPCSSRRRPSRPRRPARGSRRR
ncbi:MAG: sigma 54-interacting transcriptional regulator, partial [Sandaracinaceae bacterium]|nr:sigma 54-interacting transcriptional regulator [Sandaracinaceae bacterium]